MTTTPTLTIAIIITLLFLLILFMLLKQNKQLKDNLNSNISKQNELYAKLEQYLVDRSIAGKEAQENNGTYSEDELDRIVLKTSDENQNETYPKFEHYPIENRTPEKEVKLKRNSFLYTDDDLGEMEEGVQSDGPEEQEKKRKEIHSKFERSRIEKSTSKEEVKMKNNSFLFTDDGLGKMEGVVKK